MARKHAVSDAYVTAILAEAQRVHPDDTAPRLRVLIAEGRGDQHPAWEPTSPSCRPLGNFQRP